MKKILSVLCIIVMLFTLCSCNSGATYESFYEEGDQIISSTNSSTGNSSVQTGTNSTTSSDKTTSSNKNTANDKTSSNVTANAKDCKHSYNAATCVKASVCKLCGITVARALGHKYVNGKCQSCGAIDPSYTDWYTDGEITITKSEVQQILSMTYKKPKNVIMMICDGMGPNDIVLAEKFSKDLLLDSGTILNQFQNNGTCVTSSLSTLSGVASATDSAAAGTALATGVKTNNKHLGITLDGKILENISEKARKKGKMIGIVTTDDIAGATPAAFVAHNSSRSNYLEIAQAYAQFKPDVIIGQGYKGDADFSKVDLSKFLVATEFGKFNNALNEDPLRQKPFFGFFKEGVLEVSNTLARCTEVALNRLKNKGTGFFLMVESTAGDTWGHKQNINGKVNNVITVDRTVAVILKFMKENPDTLLIITSDHETGGVTLPSGNYALDNSLFTSNVHSSVDVRTFGVGVGSEKLNGKIDNTDFAKIAIDAICG